MSKPTLEIDGARFSTLEEFYDEISRQIIPGRAWGRNLDALTDILRGGFGTPTGGFILAWRGSSLSRDRLGYPETVRQLERHLAQCHPSNRRAVTDELSAARGSQGPTVFDWLLEIIRGSPDVDLKLE